MTQNDLAFVSFEPFGQSFRAYLAIEKALDVEATPGELAQRAAKIYEKSIKDMKSTVKTINDCRKSNKPVSAKLIWELGDRIFSLRHDLGEIGLQLDGVYDHLFRDLNVKTKWLEKVVILRRYLTRKELIPESLNWGRLEKGTSKKAKSLATCKPAE